MLPFLAALSLFAQGADDRRPISGRALKLVIHTGTAVYDIATSEDFSTTAFTPVPCKSVTVGKPKLFSATIDGQNPNRITLLTKTGRRGVVSNVTLECEDGVRILLNATTGRPEDAVQLIEFYFNKAANSRIRAAERAARASAEAVCERRLADQSKATRASALGDMLTDMAQRFESRRDLEIARQQFVVVRVSQQLLMGPRGVLILSIENRSDAPFKSAGAQVIGAGGPAADIVESLPEAVRPGEELAGAVSFVAPQGLREVDLVLSGQDGRRIEVPGIALP